MEASFYDLPTIEARREWLQEANRRRCEEATARKAADPAASLDDLTFAVVPAEGPAVDEDWEIEFNPPAR